MRISDWSSDVCSSDLHDQVADAKNALNWLTEQPGVDPLRVGVIGHSFGAAVACYAGAVEQRFACVISSCGWGNGERKFRGQHPDEMWDKFVTMLETAKREKDRTGTAPIVPSFDVVPMAEHLRTIGRASCRDRVCH